MLLSAFLTMTKFHKDQNQVSHSTAEASEFTVGTSHLLVYQQMGYIQAFEYVEEKSRFV